MHSIPLSLYIHFPWCIKKCPYCDFNSHTLPESAPYKNYVAQLMDDFTQEYTHADGRKISTVFLGGGTPSLFHADDLLPLFELIQPYCIDQAEITLEANPGTIERGQFKDYRLLGINRISLGVQSFNDRHLKKLGRIHAAREAKIAVEEIRCAGFSRFNLDLMHGLPNQTPLEALQDVREALALSPTHLSWYQLTIEPNTYFAAYPPSLPNDDHLAEIENQGMILLAEHGFSRYEISAFAKPDQECRHNLNYWNFGDYIGIGAGAHGKITHGADIIRTRKPALPKSYLNTCPAAQRHEKVVLQSETPLEFMLNALRLTGGFPKALFSARTGLAVANITAPVEKAKTMGLLIETETHLIPTARGLQFLNELLDLFLV